MTNPTYPDHVRWTPTATPPKAPSPVDIWADPTADDPPDAPCWPGCPVCGDAQGTDIPPAGDKS